MSSFWSFLNEHKKSFALLDHLKLFISFEILNRSSTSNQD